MYQSFMMIGDRLVARYNISKPAGEAATPAQPAKSSKGRGGKHDVASK